MGLVKGLKNITKTLGDEEAKFSGEDREKATWFKINDKQSVTVQFLQELDEDSPKYSEKNGVGFLAVEHSNPENFRATAQCTADEGACWACEQHRANPKAGWRPKFRLYINVLVDDGVNEPFVAILAQGNGPKSVTPVLIELASDLGQITDTLFKIKRTGKGKGDTSYMIMQQAKTDNDVEQYTLWDLDKASRKVPYDEQEEFYTRVWGQNTEEAPKKELAGTAAENEW